MCSLQVKGYNDALDYTVHTLSLPTSFALTHPLKISFINQNPRNAALGDIMAETEKTGIKKIPSRCSVNKSAPTG